ncbi:MAG: hypothetical protein JW871_07765 [Endomicrobiales bacterium]|nr:hypothetical protein [Endomicrobiales bacterium]
MQLKYHKTLTLDKWAAFPLSKRILMIGSEIQRAGSRISKNDFEEVNNCYARAFELIDLTVKSISKKTLRKELLRFRELLAREYMNKQKDIVMNQKLFDVLISLNKDSYGVLNAKNGKKT